MLIVYPMVRYALYSGLAMLLAAVMHPVLSFAIMLVIMVLELIVSPGSRNAYMPEWLRTALRRATFARCAFGNPLSDDYGSLPEATSPLDHLTALAYGLDWALVFFLLAAWLFSRRSIARD